ncbi:hypothetical protein [Erythrobacter crassostreae]|uniref:Uncharacterized protein n=1 Tax=Erythrobacter crassostreae TaxID=2828328 RepID=A0A9X1F5P8_9SPHN|nr:hypothetical protein [Erythrobacter crassostrea]MBV7259963.1 hypothetical protein [Erythrobacter crassostrea]
MSAFKKVSVVGSGLAAILYCTPAIAESCDYQSIESKPGQEWNEAYGWRYDTSQAANKEERFEENLKNREEAYTKLVKGQSPWPDWFEENDTISLLPVGTLFQMAMAEGQKDEQLGGFGTFDEIHSVSEVREDLAVLQAWKADVNRVNRYRVVEVLPVRIGPIGPQIDPDGCKMLPGRFSQFQMLVAPATRSHYVQFVSSHPIEQD